MCSGTLLLFYISLYYATCVFPVCKSPVCSATVQKGKENRQGQIQKVKLVPNICSILLI